MGAVYSSGFVPRELRPHLDRSLASVQSLYARFRRLCAEEWDNNAMFITREQFQRCLDLSTEDGHRHFSYFDRTRRGKASATEVWGALALCCSDREEPKVSFVYSLVDLDGDKALNRVELTVLLRAVGAGVARIKQIKAPTLAVVEEVVDKAFAQALATSDELAAEKGLLDLYNFGMFLKADDAIRRYLASLEREASGDAEDLYFRGADVPRTSRGDAAAATRRGDESRRLPRG